MSAFPSDGGFIGVFRERFSDFIVSEIGLDGQAVQLTSCAIVPYSQP